MRARSDPRNERARPYASVARVVDCQSVCMDNTSLNNSRYPRLGPCRVGKIDRASQEHSVDMASPCAAPGYKTPGRLPEGVARLQGGSHCAIGAAEAELVSPTSVRSPPSRGRGETSLSPRLPCTVHGGLASRRQHPPWPQTDPSWSPNQERPVAGPLPKSSRGHI